ncbi:MAG: YjbQ family protein, partial [Clostridia bacterium]|nr:YjbQ family protein [Clostridia bacterium]
MVYRESIKLRSNDREVTFHNVTAAVKEILSRSGVKNGLLSVYSHHTTCSVITQEAA